MTRIPHHAYVWTGKRMQIASMMAIAVSATACQGTIHDRWAQESDSVAVWSPRLEHMLIDLHGSIPGEDADRTREELLASDISVVPANLADGSAMGSVQRIVLYIGGNTLPMNTAYCQAAPTLRSVEIPKGRIMLAAALCDGPRLVVTARQELRASSFWKVNIGHTINEIKNRLIFALSMSPSQIPKEGTGYS
jgi:hypothetical protein